jgi:hypothetical protein
MSEITKQEDAVKALSLDDLNISMVAIDELQTEEALGIPELGASLSYYGCCSYASSL